jgi:hypothetical protein
MELYKFMKKRSTIREKEKLEYPVLSAGPAPALALGSYYLSCLYCFKPFPFPGCMPLQEVDHGTKSVRAFGYRLST